ncbi:MAG: MFS transporter [Christensenellaceae bacterium]|jgi:MFS family permease|nr:MFS transporter [Christensenellaceae bacterium]
MKFNYRKTIKVGLAFAIIMVFWTMYDYVVPLLLENTFGLSNSLRGLIMGLDNLLSLFMLPLFGKISDKAVTKYGKRTPFILFGTIAAVALMIFVPVSSFTQLQKATDLRQEILHTDKADYAYTDSNNVVFNAEELYSMLYDKGLENSDYCDHQYLKTNNINSKESYLSIALSGRYGDELTDAYKKFVQSGIDNYASDEVNEKITKHNPATIAIYMVLLFFVLVAMATFRSPAVALMPDVTPKPLRSQANAMINLVGGAGGAVAFIIYTIVLGFNPTNYVLVFMLTALAMILMLIAFLKLVKEAKLVAECEQICNDYGISDDDLDEDTPTIDVDTSEISVKKAKFRSFILILASIFMWFMGYNAVTTNLSIYMTTSLNLEPSMGGLVNGISMGISAIAFIPVGYLAVKIGRRKSIIIGFCLAITSFILIFFFAANPSSYVAILFTIFYLLSGFGLIIANVNTFPMVVELSAKNTIGKYTGWYYTATMSAQAITPFLVGLVMDAFGNKFLFLYAPICVVIAIVFMLLVKHGDSKPIPKVKKNATTELNTAT